MPSSVFAIEFAAAFREVCEALHPRTLTIVIDDLDRCRPEQVVETLEAVNFLVTAGPCYVILGIAPEQVMRCVGLGFKDIAAEMAAANVHTADEGRAWRREFAKNYLEKLINVEVPVPTLTSEDARKIVAAAGEDEQPRRLERHRVQLLDGGVLRRALRQRALCRRECPRMAAALERHGCVRSRGSGRERPMQLRRAAALRLPSLAKTTQPNPLKRPTVPFSAKASMRMHPGGAGKFLWRLWVCSAGWSC